MAENVISGVKLYPTPTGSKTPTILFEITYGPKGHFSQNVLHHIMGWNDFLKKHFCSHGLLFSQDTYLEKVGVW